MGVLVNKVRSNPLGSVDAASFQYTIVADETITFNHGFAARPRHVDLFIVAVADTLGYKAGDKVKISDSANISISVNKLNCSIALLATALPSVISLVDNTSVAITAAAWNWFITLED